MSPASAGPWAALPLASRVGSGGPASLTQRQVWPLLLGGRAQDHTGTHTCSHRVWSSPWGRQGRCAPPRVSQGSLSVCPVRAREAAPSDLSPASLAPASPPARHPRPWLLAVGASPAPLGTPHHFPLPVALLSPVGVATALHTHLHVPERSIPTPGHRHGGRSRREPSLGCSPSSRGRVVAGGWGWGAGP